LFASVDAMAGTTTNASGIAVDRHGGVYVVGSFGPTATFDPGGASEITLTSAGGGDMFLARYTAPAPLPVVLVNDYVSLVVQGTSFAPASVAGGPAGVFTITALLSNLSSQAILTPVRVVVNTLTGGNVLLSATDGSVATGSRQQIDVGVDNALGPGESIAVELRIGLATRSGFTFLVDVEGVVGTQQ